MSRRRPPLRNRLAAALPFLTVLTSIAVTSAALGAIRTGQGAGTSEVRYTATDPRSSWTGRAPLASFELRFDDGDLRRASAEATLRPESFDSGNFLRDTNARRTVFEVGDHPLIRFVLSTIEPAEIGGPVDLPDGATREVVARGRLLLHGVERTVRVPLTIDRAGATVRVVGGFEVLLSDYAMTRPSVFGLTVDDAVRLELDLEATLDGS